MVTEGKDLNVTLLKQLVCPVCFNYCTPPILMCANGHMVCKNCIDKLSDCPVCKAAKPSVRNLFAEEICSKVIVPCRNFENGCEEAFNLIDLEVHLPKCPYHTKCRIRVSSDGTLQCQWIGNSKDALLQHVKRSHPGHFYEGGEAHIHCHLNIQGSRIVDVRLFSTSGELFWVFLHYEPVTDSLYPYVRYDGDDRQARQYLSAFNFLTKDSERHVVFNNHCICLADVISLLDDISLPLHREFLKFFTHDGELHVEVTISKTQRKHES